MAAWSVVIKAKPWATQHRYFDFRPLKCTALSASDIACHRGVIVHLSLQGLSLPLVREARSGLSSWFSAGKAPSSITDCLAAFTADETLQVSSKLGGHCRWHLCVICMLPLGSHSGPHACLLMTTLRFTSCKVAS